MKNYGFTCFQVIALFVALHTHFALGQEGSPQVIQAPYSPCTGMTDPVLLRRCQKNIITKQDNELNTNSTCGTYTEAMNSALKDANDACSHSGLGHSFGYCRKQAASCASTLSNTYNGSGTGLFGQLAGGASTCPSLTSEKADEKKKDFTDQMTSYNQRKSERAQQINDQTAKLNEDKSKYGADSIDLEKQQSDTVNSAANFQLDFISTTKDQLAQQQDVLYAINTNIAKVKGEIQIAQVAMINKIREEEQKCLDGVKADQGLYLSKKSQLPSQDVKYLGPLKESSAKTIKDNYAICLKSAVLKKNAYQAEFDAKKSELEGNLLQLQTNFSNAQTKIATIKDNVAKKLAINQSQTSTTLTALLKKEQTVANFLNAESQRMVQLQQSIDNQNQMELMQTMLAGQSVMGLNVPDGVTATINDVVPAIGDFDAAVVSAYKACCFNENEESDFKNKQCATPKVFYDTGSKQGFDNRYRRKNGAK